jgi:hypothetical protein
VPWKSLPPHIDLILEEYLEVQVTGEPGDDLVGEARQRKDGPAMLDGDVCCGLGRACLPTVWSS